MIVDLAEKQKLDKIIEKKIEEDLEGVCYVLSEKTSLPVEAIFERYPNRKVYYRIQVGSQDRPAFYYIAPDGKVETEPPTGDKNSLSVVLYFNRRAPSKYKRRRTYKGDTHVLTLRFQLTIIEEYLGSDLKVLKRYCKKQRGTSLKTVSLLKEGVWEEWNTDALIYDAERSWMQEKDNVPIVMVTDKGTYRVPNWKYLLVMKRLKQGWRGLKILFAEREQATEKKEVKKSSVTFDKPFPVPVRGNRG